MASKEKLPASLRTLVEEVGKPVISEQIADFERLQMIKDRSKRHRTIINVWKQPQDQDRRMRKRYATWLMILMTIQVVLINVIVVLIGCGLLVLEQ